MMRVISEKPLIFVDADSADEISVHFRSTYHQVMAALKKINHPFVPLNDIIEEDSAITYGIVQAGDHFDNGVPMLKVTNFLEGRRLNDGPFELVNPALAAKFKRSKLKEGDILLSIRGSVGKIAYVPKRLEGANLNQDIAVIRLADKKDNDFVALYLESDLARLQMTLHTRGAAVQGINLKELREVKIPVLSSDEKACIQDRYELIRNLETETLSQIDSIKDELKRSTGVQIDSAFASELYLQQFAVKASAKVFMASRDAERLDIPANHPDYTKLVNQIKASANSGALFDLVEVPADRFNPDECIGREINYLAIGDIDGIAGNLIEPQKMLAEELPSRARRLIHAGDILIATVSQGDEKTVVFLADKAHEGWVASTGFLIVRAKKDVQAEYVVRLLKAPFVLRQYSALVAGSSMPTISQQDILNFAVPVTTTASREKTLSEINQVLKEERQLTIQLEQISEQIEQLLSEAKSNILDLLDGEKFFAMSARAQKIEAAMAKIEEALQ
jgi:type I restriction enzyme S subunit